MTLTTMANAERGRLVIDVVDALDSLAADGEWTERDLPDLLGGVDLTVRGLVEYAQFLEAVLVARGLAVPQIHDAARQTAAKLTAR